MKNNIRYKGNTNNTSVIIFLKSKVKKSQRWYFAWENRRGGFCDANLHFIFDPHFVVVLHLSMFFICQCSSFTFSFRRHPSPFRGLWPGFYTHFIISVYLAHCRVIRETFIFNHSVIFLPRALRALSGHFLPTGVFYLTLLQRHFNMYLYQGFSGSRQVFLEVCTALSCSQITGQVHLLV